MIPFILVSQFYNPETEQKYLSIWYAATTLVRVFSYGLIFYLQSKFHWTDCMLVVGGIFILFTLLNQLTIPEVEADAGSNNNGESFAFLKEYLSDPRQFLLTADFYLTFSILVNLLTWAPYYLDTVGVRNYSVIVSLTGLFFTAGAIFMESLIGTCPSGIKIITTAYLICMLLLHAYWLLVPESPESFIPYFVIFCMIDFFQAGPNSRVNGEISQSVNNDPFKKSVVFNFGLLMR